MSGGHYFDEEPVVTSSRRSVPLVLPDLSVTLSTDRGVFAGHGVDPGTKLLLLEGRQPPATGDLLDLGCGYGPIAVALGRRAPGATVWAVDVNRRALELCAENASAAGLTNVRASTPEDVPADLRLAGLWSNPPVRVGKAALQSMLTTWLGRLVPGSVGTLVVHRNLGADPLARWLGEQGWTVERARSRMGYRLLEVTRSP